MKNNSLFLTLGLFAMTIASCDIREPFEDTPINELKDGYLGINLPNGFNFATTKTVSLNLSAVSGDNSPIPHVTYRIFDGNPNREGQLLQTIRLNEQGTAVTTLDIPSHLGEIWVTSSYIGVEPVAIVPVQGLHVTYRYDAAQPSILPDSFFDSDNSGANARLAGIGPEIQTLGSWDSNGKPSYLVEPDKVSYQLIKNVNTSLPENMDVREHNPKILDDKYTREMYLNEDAEVWITYVHTGAGYRNAIGYYWYMDGEKPMSAEEVKNKTIIFPNIQHGVLASGDKVKLRGPKDGAFEKGTHIGWFLIADGWQNGNLTNGHWTLFADRELNSSVKSYSLKDHMVFLYDASERILLMGWEDIRRDQAGCDHDFNDVVFYATWNPITSVDLDDYPGIDTKEKDRDGDGVADYLDEYPDDPERAFNNYSPGKNTFGTLLFEDLWPSYGDYDLNDLVVDYQVNEVSDANNRVKDVVFTTVVRATGAGYKNGFGVQLPISASQVKSVEGYRHTTGSINVLPSGVEDGQRMTTVIIVDDVNHKLPVMSNVSLDNPHHQEDTIKVKITFAEAVRKADLGSAPYNPFMIINQDRGREVHLWNKEPTDLMSHDFLGSSDDASNASQGRYFVSKNGFNWALHIPKSIPYTQEKVDFTKAYVKFADWAKSGGTAHQDWYLFTDDRVNKSALYLK